MKKQELVINLKVLDVSEEKLDNYAAAVYKSAKFNNVQTRLVNCPAIVLIYFDYCGAID